MLSKKISKLSQNKSYKLLANFTDLGILHFSNTKYKWISEGNWQEIKQIRY